MATTHKPRGTFNIFFQEWLQQCKGIVDALINIREVTHQIYMEQRYCTFVNINQSLAHSRFVLPNFHIQFAHHAGAWWEDMSRTDKAPYENEASNLDKVLSSSNWASRLMRLPTFRQTYSCSIRISRSFKGNTHTYEGELMEDGEVEFDPNEEPVKIIEIESNP
ncbi:hypothetical protein LOK49_LG11G01317 [Camellia lanceoleosa]|uniref:Uncharacterized protein n=1 Tax=Camellia lanceoleosa TaxID=1840588 RepID=A0ACC0G4W8_9ERIC|nr:hypothetical protein LOK49_LG11G01317 [Camellia lanceoleosa]